MRAMLFLKIKTVNYKDIVQTIQSTTLTLALAMPRIHTNYAHHALAPDDLAFAAHFFNRSPNFHLVSFPLLGPKHDAGTSQIVWGKFHRHFVAGQDANVVHAHLPGNMS
jgi:hypothetical protein